MIYENNQTPEGPETGGSSEIPEKADELLDAARKRGRGLLERQKEATVRELGSVAEALHEAARKLGENQDEMLAPAVEKGAGLVDRLSKTLKEHDIQDLLGRAQRSLRERPAISLGVAAAIGFAIGRIVRAGSARIAEEASEDSEE